MDPFNTTSFALSILLVFRTQASYERWAEAREIWGGIVVHARDLARQVQTALPFSYMFQMLAHTGVVRTCFSSVSPLQLSPEGFN